MSSPRAASSPTAVETGRPPRPDQLSEHAVREHELPRDHPVDQQQARVLGVRLLPAGAPRTPGEPAQLDVELATAELAPIVGHEHPEVRVEVQQWKLATHAHTDPSGYLPGALPIRAPAVRAASVMSMTHVGAPAGLGGKARSDHPNEGDAAMAKAARDIMTPDAKCVGENDTVLDAAKQLAQLDVGSMPICGEDDRLKGMLTDRDIVVKVLAKDKDPASTKVSELADQGEVVTIGADDPIDEALRTMTEHKVRRLPVIDEQRLVGIISQADIATNIDEEKVGDLVEAISASS
jgi:CBS domain-containing protein